MARRPKQVDAAARRAEELSRVQHGDEGQQQELPLDQQQQETQPVEQQESQGQQEQQSVEQPPATVEHTPPIDWEQRYRSLQGKYNYEVPMLQRQIQNLQDRLQQMETRNNAPPAQSTQSAPAQGEGEKPLVTQQEIEEYGEDLVGLIDKVARQRAEVIARQEVTALKQETERLRERFSQTDQETKQGRVQDRLDKDVPNWREINRSQAFKDWLSEVDTFSGVLRQQLLMRAYEAGDGQRVVQFFRAFRNAANVPEGQAQTEPQPSGRREGEPSPSAPQRPDMRQFAAPGSPNGNAVQKPSEQRQPNTWTPAQISAFYADVRRGKFNDNPELKARIEADLEGAVREGRVVRS